VRALFNNGGFVQRQRHGHLTLQVLSQNHPAAPLAKEPFCTWSQRVGYFNLSGLQVAEVHQYLRPDGTIGLSGDPGPKMVLDHGVEYYADDFV